MRRVTATQLRGPSSSSTNDHHVALRCFNFVAQHRCCRHRLQRRDGWFAGPARGQRSGGPGGGAHAGLRGLSHLERGHADRRWAGGKRGHRQRDSRRHRRRAAHALLEHARRPRPERRRGSQHRRVVVEAQHCAACHGDDLSGSDGSGGSTVFAANITSDREMCSDSHTSACE